MVYIEKGRSSTQMIDIRQTTQYAHFMSLQGWKVETTDETNYFIKKIPLIGSILKIQHPRKIGFQFINELEKKYKVFQTIIEPDLGSYAVSTKSNSAPSGTLTIHNHKLLLSHGYKLSNSPYLPTKTLLIDLTQSKNKIYDKLARNIKTGIKRNSIKIIDGNPKWGSGLFKEYSSPKELQIFHGAWKKSVKFKHFVPPLTTLINIKKSFPQSHSLFLASHNISSRIIGGVIFTRTLHGVANYVYGFTSSEGRTSLAHAALLYQGILWGKEMGCVVFDFEGIYDSRFPNKSWLGFTRFKKSFGGYEVSYPGTYTKFRLPI